MTDLDKIEYLLCRGYEIFATREALNHGPFRRHHVKAHLTHEINAGGRFMCFKDMAELHFERDLATLVGSVYYIEKSREPKLNRFTL